MSNTFKITCPSCKKEFDAGNAFNLHFEKAKIASEKDIKNAKFETDKYKSQLENNKKEIEKVKADAVKKAEEEASKKYKSQLENSQKEIEKAKVDAGKKAEEEAAKKYKSQLENSQKEIEKDKKIAEKKAEEEAAKKFKAQLESQKEELEKNKKSQEILHKRIEERTQQVNEMMKERSVELQGEVQEERLQDFLRSNFPDDEVEEIKKGAKGGDCILTINYKGKRNIAKIYFESKDTKAFQEKWVDKLLNDMKDKGIANGIIVVSKSALPPDFNTLGSYVERYGNTITIIPLVFPIIHAIVSKIRSILILKSRENNNHQVPELMKKAFDNLQSPNFILPVKSMISQINAMEKLFKKDKETFQRSAAHKDRTIKEINDNIVDMINSFYVNVGDIFPPDLLSHEENLLEENRPPKIPKLSNKTINQNIEEVQIINPDLNNEFLDIIKINIHKEWSLSIKTFLALKDLDILYVGDLIVYNETDLLRARNFGQKSLDELKVYMDSYSLTFGSEIKEWNLKREQLISNDN